MESYNEWKKELKKDSAGGLVPEDLKKAKRVDLVTLPSKIEGTNCSNCKFINSEGFCENKEVQMLVNKRMCCALWDAKGTIRSWIK